MVGRLMTVGDLSERTGVSIKLLREYADTGLIRTVGRSPANYRLFDETALACIRSIATMRCLGLTVAEIRQLAEAACRHPDRPVGPQVAGMLSAARSRVDARIAELQRVRQRIDAFESIYRAELAGQAPAGWWPDDPVICVRT